MTMEEAMLPVVLLSVDCVMSVFVGVC